MARRKSSRKQNNKNKSPALLCPDTEHADVEKDLSQDNDQPAGAGKLFLVATPLGNLADITIRALDTLRAVDLILCEDTRHSVRLLAHYEIKKPLLSLHEHNEKARIGQVITELQAGKNLALISDAGTPLISDPGYRLVNAALAAGIEIDALPGPCAAINALLLSAFPTHKFCFFGFLSPKSSARKRVFQEQRENEATLIFYESPFRVKKFLQDAYEVLGDRPVVCAREMTKKFQEVMRASLGELISSIESRSLKGEFVLLIQGYSRKKATTVTTDAVVS